MLIKGFRFASIPCLFDDSSSWLNALYVSESDPKLIYNRYAALGDGPMVTR
jgi:hypothetical protein